MMGNIRMLRRGLRGVISRRALLDGSKYGYHVQGKLIDSSQGRTVEYDNFLSATCRSAIRLSLARFTLPLYTDGLRVWV